jgi:hypothetical protein
MPRRAARADQLSVAALVERSHSSGDVSERGQWHAIWLGATGHPVDETAAIVGYSVAWLWTRIRRNNAAGAAGIEDRRHANPGGTALLSAADRVDVRTVLGEPAPDGGRGTGQQVAAWMSVRLGRPVSAQRGWDALRRWGCSPHRPPPCEPRADPAVPAAFHKGGWHASASASTPPTPPRS